MPERDGDGADAPRLHRGWRRHRQWPARARSALRRSLRLRLVLVFWMLALVLSLLFFGGLQQALGKGWRLAVAPLLSDYVDRLAAEIGTPPSIERARALTERLPVSVQIDGPQVRWSSAGAGQGGTEDRVAAPARFGGPPEHPRLLERRTADGHTVRFGLGELPWQSEAQRIRVWTLFLLLAATALAYAYVRHLLRPLDDIRAGAARFGAGDFTQPVVPRRDDELGDLARQINTTAAQLHQMLEGKRALLLAISHELRSPLTRARLHAELLPEQGDAAATRAALLRDLAEMRDLVADLLEGERLASGHAALQREPVAPAALVAELLASRPDFAAVEAQVPDGLAQVLLDAPRLRLALRNLLDNALRHGAGATRPPCLQVARQGELLVFTVRDFGPGVDPALLPRLAQAFYRPDDARQRSTGGVGLGLYLCRLVAEAHGGQLVLGNAAPGLQAALVLRTAPG